MKSFVLELTSKGEIVCNKHDEEHKKIENDLRRIFKKYDCIFFNAAKVIESSKVDSLHLMPEAHKKLAEELYKCIMENE